MHCFDCSSSGTVRPAIAVCHGCGAAVCAQHAVARPHHLQRTVPINRHVAVEPAARVLRCTTCDTAQVALHEDVARHPNHDR